MTRRRKAFALFATALLVLSAVPTGTAGQSITGDECDPSAVDYGVAVLSPATAAYNYVTSDGCAVEEVLDGNKEQEMQDVHANAQTLAATEQGTLDGRFNSLENARTVAWTKAEVATLQALENNRSQSQVRIEAREAVRDYYSRQIHNFIQEQNARVEEIWYNYQVVQNESLNASTLVPKEDSSQYPITALTQPVNKTVSLPNGSTVTARVLEWEDSESVSGSVSDEIWVDDMSEPRLTGFRIESTYNGSTVSLYNISEYDQLLTEMRNQNQQMLDNMNSTVNGLYGSYVRGDLDIEEYRSVQAAAMGWGQDLSETGYSTYAVVALAQAGEEVPDLNATGSMTIESAQFQTNGTNETLTGLVVGEPTDGSTSWQVGQTYDPANSNGTVTFHVEASNRSMELTEPFTLVGAEGKEGQEITTVETQQYNYRTSNFSELGTKLDLLIELRQEEQERIEEASNPENGGTIGWPGLGGGGALGLTGGLVVVGIIAVVLFAARTYLDVLSP